MGAFTAGAIKETYASLSSNAQNCARGVGEISSQLCKPLENIFTQSDDSDYADQWKGLADACTAIQNTVNTLFNQINSQVDSYVQSTVTTEASASSSLGQNTTAIKTSTDELDKIASKYSAS